MPFRRRMRFGPIRVGATRVLSQSRLLSFSRIVPMSNEVDLAKLAAEAQQVINPFTSGLEALSFNFN